VQILGRDPRSTKPPRASKGAGQPRRWSIEAEAVGVVAAAAGGAVIACTKLTSPASVMTARHAVTARRSLAAGAAFQFM
jgi:hypothetical protein